MALLFKISSSYGKLSIITLLIFALFKHEIIHNLYPICTLRTYIALFCKIVFNKNTSANANVSKTDFCTTVGRQGFTLLELITTVAVLAVIIAIATPAIQTQLARMEAKRIKNQIENTLNLAKAESYIRKKNVIVCLSDTKGHCDRNSNKWLLAFIDKSHSKNFDAQVDVLITQQSLNLKYSRLSLRVGNRRHYIKFWGDSGTPRGHFGHIKYCPTVAYNKAMYLISFNQTGIIKQKFNKNHPTQCGK